MLRLAALLAVLLTAPLPSLADDAAPQPTAQIRALTRKFDAIAYASASTTAAITEARAQYGKFLREAEASGAKSETLREHAEIFVMSGGDVSSLRAFGEGLQSGTAEKKLFEGILAYGEGRVVRAEGLLLPLDALSFDPMRGGHLSLVQALLTSRSTPERAFEYFEKARLLLPGTLVEEAALRQIAVLAAKTSDRARFASAAISYLSRFRRSAYVAGFETQLAFHIVRFEGRDGLLILQELLHAEPKGWGRCLSCFLMSIAEQAVVLGKVELAIAAAEAAMPLVPEDSPEKQRLRLYSGAALIVTEGHARGSEALNAVRAAQLSEKDRQLLLASRALAAKLRAIPAPLTGLKEADSVDATKPRAGFIPGKRQAEAKAALASVNAILARAR